MTSRDEVIRSASGKPSAYDFEATRHGTFILLRPLNVDAAEWLYDHVAPDSMWHDGALVVELGYIDTIVEGALEAGFDFERRTMH